MDSGKLNIKGNLSGKDYEALVSNDILNAFRIAIGNSISVQKMQDGIVDEFEDQTGIDTGNSVNILYDTTDDYYSLGEGDTTTVDNMEYASNGDAQTAYVTTDGTYLVVSSEDTIKTQGSYALKLVASITNSLYDLVRKTFSSVVDLSNRSILKIKARTTRSGTNFKL